MNKIFKTDFNQDYFNIIILVVRLLVAAFMITHGFPKLMKLMAGGEIQFADPLGLGPALSLVLVVFAEFFCSIFIAFGIGTRLASIPLIITMLVAAFIAHSDDPFGQKEKALLYVLIYLVLLVVGSGKFSLDYLISSKKNN